MPSPKKIGWDKPAPQGVFSRHRAAHGLCQLCRRGGRKSRSPTATKIKVHRIVAATDRAYAVNPARSNGQVAGSFVYGLSGLFYGGCTVKDGRIEQTNFDTYNSIADRRDAKGGVHHHAERRLLGGVGEPTICVAAPAVLNAYFAATASEFARCRCETRTSPLPDAASGGLPKGPPPHFRIMLMDALRLMTRRNVVRGIAAVSRVVCLPVPFPRAICRAHHRGRRRLWRRKLCAGAEAHRSKAAGDADRAEPNLYRLSVQQRGDRGLAGNRSAAIQL